MDQGIQLVRLQDFEEKTVEIDDNLVSINSQLSITSQKLEQTVSQNELQVALSSKTDQVYVDTLVSQLTTSAPRDVFLSIAALNAAFPNGDSGFYIVYDSSFADGAHAFIFSQVDNQWKDSGLWKGDGVEDNAVNKNKVSSDVLNAINKDNKFPNFKTQWENGSIDTTTGALLSNNVRMRTINFIPVNGRTIQVIPPTGFSMAVLKYTASQTFVGFNAYSPTERLLSIDETNVALIKLMMFWTANDATPPLPLFDKIGYLYEPKEVNNKAGSWQYGSILSGTSENGGTTRIKSSFMTINKGTNVELKTLDFTSFIVDVYNSDKTYRERLNNTWFNSLTYSAYSDCLIRITLRYDDNRVINDRLMLADLLTVNIKNYALSPTFKHGGMNTAGVLNTVNTRSNAKIIVPFDCALDVTNTPTVSYFMRVFKDGVQLSDTVATTDFSTGQKTFLLLTGFEYYLVFKYADDRVIDLQTANEALILKYKRNLTDKNTIKVATHNVGMFGGGVTTGIPDDDITPWRDFLANENIDIYMVQEFTPRITTNMLTDTFYSNWYKYRRILSGWFGFLNKYPQLDMSFTIPLTPHPTRGNVALRKTYTLIDGKRVALFNTHLPAGKEEVDYLARELNHQEILTEILREERFILCADFNPWRNTRYTQIYIDAGCKVANLGDFFPSFNTAESDAISIDNIIVSPNINIDNVRKSEYLTSDHRSVIAIITVE